jgi:hypothetical protein
MVSYPIFHRRSNSPTGQWLPIPCSLASRASLAKAARVLIADRAFQFGAWVQMNQDFGHPSEVLRKDVSQFCHLSVTTLENSCRRSSLAVSNATSNSWALLSQFTCRTPFYRPKDVRQQSVTADIRLTPQVIVQLPWLSRRRRALHPMRSG